MKTQYDCRLVELGQGRRARCKICGFTLVELMVVIAVMISIIGVVVPAFNGIGKSGLLNRGGDLVANLLNFARQNSLSKNAMTALIVVTDPAMDDQNRMFTMLELQPAQTGHTSVWKQIAKWEPLATGIVVNNWTVQSAGTNTVSPALPSLHYGDRTISQFKSIIFMPDGSTYNDGPTTFELVEGYYPKGASTPSLTGLSKNGEATNYYKLTVLNSTGRVKIERP